jgi:hypothetical protein
MKNHYRSLSPDERKIVSNTCPLTSVYQVSDIIGEPNTDATSILNIGVRKNEKKAHVPHRANAHYFSFTDDTACVRLGV